MNGTVRKIYLAVCGGIAALGLVLIGAGFALGGFDPRLFTTTVNLATGKVVLGGTVVEDYETLLVANILETVGSIDTSALDASAPEDSEVSAVPEVPVAPDAPAAPASPAASESPAA